MFRSVLNHPQGDIYFSLRQLLKINFLGMWKHALQARTTCQPDLTTFLQPRHIPTRGYNITQSSAPDDGHMVARNMLSNY